MERTFKLVIEYDGTDYHGWQVQKGDRTVQGEIEAALATILKRRVVVSGSGRTDAGVHALGQTASFRCDTHLSADIFQRALNSLLAPDTVILSCTEVDDDFHARFSALGKVYRYQIRNHPLPSAVGRAYHWHMGKPLDVEAMGRAARHLVGTHDFKAFEGAGSPRSHTIRRIMAAELTDGGDGMLAFRIEADGFLRFMVRNIVGTLVEVGLGKRSPEGFRAAMESLDRSQAGPTAPPHGLFLVEVRYSPE